MDPLEPYNYTLPPELIAHEPAEPRDSARLFVYDTATNSVSFGTVRDLPQLLPGAQFIYNDTRVLPARLQGRGAAHKPVELLVLVDQGFSNGEVRALVNRFTPVGETIIVANHTFTVRDNVAKSMVMQFSGNETELQELLQTAGETPLPPYIDSELPEAAKRERYQSMFAKTAPSVAAPTASLHFTDRLKAEIETTGAHFAPVTLQVGLGTFAPVFAEHFEQKTLHHELCTVPETTARAILTAKQAHRPVVAIGTTVIRTLESTYEPVLAGKGDVVNTDLFIFPPYQFHIPDAVMTNFHVPRSSLMCLVEAYLQDKGAKRSLLELYQIAIKEQFRFYSFGDAMLIV